MQAIKRLLRQRQSSYIGYPSYIIGTSNNNIWIPYYSLKCNIEIIRKKDKKAILYGIPDYMNRSYPSVSSYKRMLSENIYSLSYIYKFHPASVPRDIFSTYMTLYETNRDTKEVDILMLLTINNQYSFEFIETVNEQFVELSREVSSSTAMRKIEAGLEFDPSKFKLILNTKLLRSDYNTLFKKLNEYIFPEFFTNNIKIEFVPDIISEVYSNPGGEIKSFDTIEEMEKHLEGLTDIVFNSETYEQNTTFEL